jgi:hypothetical protein
VTAFTITVPLPPSANALTRNVKGRGRVNTAGYNLWLEEAGYTARMAHRAAGKPVFEKPLAVTLQLGLRDRRRDAGNCLKPTEDMLVKSIEGLPDDRWNDDISIKRDAAIPSGMVRITITSLLGAPPG